MHLPHIQPFEKNPRYFFTACLEGRRPVLACQAVFDLLSGIWTRSAVHDGWFVGRFVIMPDHVHFFAMSAHEAKPRAEWHKMWKSVSARFLVWEFNIGSPVWQPDTFDHILRNKKSYAEKWAYVRENPVRKGLVGSVAEWQWQGEINVLRLE
jgi:putative transposase